jgi:hypothetical protein
LDWSERVWCCPGAENQLKAEAVPGVTRVRLSRLILSLMGMDRVPNAVSELAQALGTPKALGDALQALLNGDQNELDRALIGLATASSPELAAEEEGVLRGLLSVVRGDIYSVTDLVRALRLNKDVIEVCFCCLAPSACLSF